MEKALGGVTGGIYQLWCYLSGAPIDYESAWYLPGKLADAAREEVAADIRESMGESKAGKLAGNLGARGYQILMGTGDFAAATVMTCGYGTFLVGAEAYEQAGRTAAERGLGAEAIQTQAAVAAAGDMILNQVFTGGGQGLKNWTEGGVTASLGGGLSDLVDSLTAGMNSRKEETYRQYLQEGMTSDEARGQLLLDSLARRSEEFVQGFATAAFDTGKQMLEGKKTDGQTSAGNTALEMPETQKGNQKTTPESETSEKSKGGTAVPKFNVNEVRPQLKTEPDTAFFGLERQMV